jgi:hypothetical protein
MNSLKKVLGASLVAAFAIASTAGATTFTFTKTLKQGSKGADVKNLQMFLNMCSDTMVTAAGKETTSFGPATKKAVMAFQKKNGINATGVFGSASAKAAATAQAAKDPCAAITGGTMTSGNTGTTTGGTTTQTGPVKAMLATDTPAAGYVVTNQATADLAHFAFSGAGTLSSITLTRTGISSQSDLANVYLYDGATRLTDGYSFNNSGTLTMNNLGIAISGTKTLSVKADIGSGSGYTVGSTVGVTLTGFTAGTTASTASISGNTMYLGTGALASVYLPTQASVAVPNANVNAGTSAYTVWSAPVQVNTRAIWLKGANFRMVGSAPADALANIKLYVDGVSTGAAAIVSAINGSNYAMFDFSGSPVNLTTGSHTVDVRADVAKGSSYTVQTSLQQAADLVLYDSQIGVNIAPAVSSTVAFSSNNAGTITINAGSASVVIDPTFSAMTNITGGATNVAIAKFKVHGYGENVKVSTLSVTPSISGTTPSAAGLNNVTLYFNGSQVGSQQSWISGALSFNLGSQMIIPAAADSTIEVRADLQTTGSVNYTAGSISATLATGSSNGQGQTSHTTLNFPTSTVAGTSLTIQTGLLAVSAAGGYTSQNASPNTAGVKIGSFTLQNQSSAESINVTGLGVALAFATPTYTSGTVTAGSQSVTFSSTSGMTVGNIITIPGATAAIGTITSITSGTVAVVNITTGGVTPTVGGAVTGSGATSLATLTNFSNLRTSETSGSGATPVQPSSSNTFSVNFSLAPGATKTIDVLADTSTANMGAVTSTLTVTSLGANSHVSITQTGAGTGQTISLASGTINTTPTLLTASATTSQYVAAANGATDATKATFNFAATGGTATITKLRFTATGSTTVTSVRVGTTSAPIVAGVAYLTGLNLTVPNGSSGLNQDVFVSYPVVGATGTSSVASGTTSQLALTYVEYTSGGTTAFFSPSTNAPQMTLVGSKPTVSAAKPATVVAAGNVEAIDVTVAADAAGNITLNTLPITVTPSNAAMGTSANTIIVKDANNTTVATTNTAFGSSAGGATTITFTGGYTIQGGQSQTFKVYVPVATTTPSGVNSVSLSTVTASGSNFSWTDVAGGAGSAQTGTTLIPSYPSTFTSVIYN